MTITNRILSSADSTVLQNVAPDVLSIQLTPDGVQSSWPTHAITSPSPQDDDSGQVVGMAFGLHYVHPDKPPELWVNEVGVAATHQGRGLGRQVLAALLWRTV